MQPSFTQFRDSGRAYRHVIALGQSLGGGAYGVPIINRLPRYANVMFDGGGQYGLEFTTDPAVLRTTDLARLVPLRAQVSRHNSNTGESVLLGFANYLGSKLGPGVYDMICSNGAVGGAAYVHLSKTGASITTITRSGQTATVTCAGAHGLLNGCRVVISGANEPEYNIPALITYLNSTQFSYTVSGTPATPATGTIRWRTMHYERVIDQIRRAWMLVGKAGYQVGGFIVVHGEGDGPNAAYDTDIRTWQSDYQTQIQAMTGQTNIIPMFHTQMSNWTMFGSATTTSPYKVLSEFKTNPTKTILVGAKYVFPYAVDGIHMPASSYEWVGEYYGKAFHQHVITGKQWKPLYPVTVTRTDRDIVATFPDAVGELVLDTQTILNPGNYGFEYYDAGGPSATIQSVRLEPGSKVRIILNTVPTGATKKLRYAYTGIVNRFGGPYTGPRGCLRDSDRTRGPSGKDLYNWCVHFDEPIT